MNKLDIREMGASIGLSLLGVCGVEPPAELEKRLIMRREQGRATPFEEKDIARRLDPRGLLPGCRAVITLAVPYCLPDFDLPQPAAGPRGTVARCARGPDYHLLVKEAAQRLVNLLQKELPGLSYLILSDRNPLVERELARLSGLGGSGENCTLITGSYGSYVALGTILIDRYLEPTAPLAGECLHCGRCREACPTGALIAPYLLDPYRCLSYISQAPGVVPEQFRPLLGSRIYGCDTCQEACPANRTAALPSPAGFPCFPPRPLLLPLLFMTRREFAQTVEMTSAGWRGKTVLQRNAVIALGNCGDPDAVPMLGRLLRDDPRPVIRFHAAWALGKLGSGKAGQYLAACCRRDPDPLVREEARRRLERL